MSEEKKTILAFTEWCAENYDYRNGAWYLKDFAEGGGNTTAYLYEIFTIQHILTS